MADYQPGILAPLPRLARYVSFALRPNSDPRAALKALAARADGVRTVVGLGASLVSSLGAEVPGLRPMPTWPKARVDLPVTPGALWCWLRGDGEADRGDLVVRSAQLIAQLAGAFTPDLIVDGFRHHEGRDLTGYEDGTENPKGDAALEATFVDGTVPGLAGSSFVAVQQWVHDFSRFAALGSQAQDDAIGRRRSDNEELDDAPESSHVKRTAQESFEPEAFMLRRSMPWTLASDAGLHFVAFGRSFDAFEAQMRRMAGIEDGIVDALFTFSRPLNGSYFWCPPLAGGALDLSLLRL